MNILIVLLVVLLYAEPLIAQESTVLANDKVHKFVQVKAEPVEGMSNFLQNFSNQFNALVIPPKFDEVLFKLQFVIEKNGTFSNIEIKENEHAYAYIEEVIRVLKIMRPWKPGEINGSVVRSVYEIPIKLRFPMRSVDKALLDKAILERTVKTEYFEFECNCKLINSTTNQYNKIKEFAYNTADNNVFYSVTLKEILVANAKNHFEIIKANIKKQNVTINELTYKNHKAIESSFVVQGNKNTFYNNTIYFVVGNQLVTLTVISSNEQISKFNFADLKQTFKLTN